jgi:sugar lactone lactonase YvrE
MTVEAQNNITTVAGGGPPGVTTTGITRLTASVGAAQAVRKDSAGNFYILDNLFSRVYKVDPTDHLTVYAGNGTIGFSGEGGLATDAAMFEPSGMCIDSANNIYVADSDNAIVREIPATSQTFPFAMTAGHIYTVAGTQETSYSYGGDGLLATAVGVHLHFPDGCSVDSHGNLFIADRGNNAIRVVIGQANVPPAGLTGTMPGHIYLYTGSIGAVPPAPPAMGFGAEGSPSVGAALNGPFDVFVDPHDNVFIADLGNDNTLSNEVVREVPATAQTLPFAMAAGNIYTVAGTKQTVGPATSGGLATAATLNGPKGIFVDAAGNLFFADNGNEVIREVAGATPSPGMTAAHIYNIACNASAGFSGDTHVALTASLNHPNGAFVDSTGQVFISDTQDDRVRLVSSNTGSYLTETINTWAGNGLPSFSDATTALNGQLDTPAGIAVDAAGDLLIADVGLFGGEQSLIRKVAVANPISMGVLTTLVGSPGFSGFVNSNTGNYPNYVENDAAGVTSDASGNVYIADTKNCIIRELSAGVMTTVAGMPPTVDVNNPPNSTPNCGFTAAGGPAVGTGLGTIKTVMINGHPVQVTFGVNSVALDASGNLFFSDSGNNVIWEVPKNSTTTMTAGDAYIVAGTPSTTGKFGGEAGAATAASLNNPTGIYFDVYGNLFIADTGNNIIREIPADNTSAMTAGNIYTVAGDKAGQTAGYSGDSGVATSAQLNAPFTIAVDNAGSIFIADTNNHVIREVPGVTVAPKTKGNIYTVVGTNVPPLAGFGGDGGAATSANAKLDAPQGLAFDSAGNLLIGDSLNNRVRSVATIANLAPVPVASFDKSILTFLAQPLNIKSTAKVVTLTNNGGAALTGIAITTTGTGFANTTTCTATLNPAANCTISVTFTPTVVGASSGMVSIVDSAANTPQTITLNGTGQTGVPVDVVTPNPLAFTPQPVGVPSAALPVTVGNLTGTGPLVITGITFGGTNGSDFSQTNTCGTLPATVAVGATCTINVVFNPTSGTPAARTATLTLADNATNSSINITGTATVATISFAPTSLTFASQTVATASAPQAITVKNTGTAALTFTGITIAGPNKGDFSLAPAATCTTATPLAPNMTCTISVTYKPAAAGTSTAMVTVVDNATGVSQTINLTGTATATPPALTLNLAAASGGSTTATVAAGATATYMLQISANQNATVTFACTGAPTAATCNAPASTAVTANTPAAVSVTVATTARGMLVPQSEPTIRMQPPAAIRMLTFSALAMLLLIATLLAATQSPAGRLRFARVALSACLVLMPIAAATLIVGCGGGSSSTTPPPVTGTPAGTYMITVTATSGSTTANTQLTLVVQ